MLPHIDGQVLVDGQFTSAEVQRTILALKEYDPNIEVAWDKSAEKRGAAMFRISYEPPGEEPYVITYVKNETEFNESLLARIIAGDQRRGKLLLSDLEAREAAHKLVEHQKWLDDLEAINDIAYHAFRTHKNTYKIGDDLTIKDGIPHNAAHLDGNNAVKRGAPSFDLSRFLTK